MEKDRFLKVVDVAKRAEQELDGWNCKRLDVLMDLEFCDEDCPLDFDVLLSFPKADFAHDMYGIQNHFNRQTKKLENCFLPRCAKVTSTKDTDVKQKMTFKFEAWIHPKHGGDDYPVQGTVDAINEDVAKIAITKHLKRKSAVVDFRIIKKVK